MSNLTQILEEIIKIHTKHLDGDLTKQSEEKEMELLMEAYMLVTGKKAKMSKAGLDYDIVIR